MEKDIHKNRDAFEEVYAKKCLADTGCHVSLGFLRGMRENETSYCGGHDFLNGAWLGWELGAVYALEQIQSQLDAIGAGGVSGQRVIRPHIPEGYKLVPIEPTPQQIQAMRTGSYKDWPSDELCRVRYAAMLAAS